MPKNRQTLFAVVRTQFEETGHGTYERLNPVLCGVYHSMDRAEEIQGKHEQEMKDKGFDEFFYFEVQTVTYYDE